MERSSRAGGGQGLTEVAALVLRLGAPAFGGPAAHVVLIERECVERRRWIVAGGAFILPAAMMIAVLPASSRRCRRCCSMLAAALTGAVSGLAGLGSPDQFTSL